MSPLPLQDWQWDAFAGELDSHGVPELMGREAPPDPGLGAEAAELRADRGA